MATESDTPNTAALSTIIAVGALSMVAIVAAITALVRSTENAQRNKVNSTANLQIYRELVASQRAELTAPPTWVSRSKGLVSIPIDRAETQVIKNIRANPYAATPMVPDAGATADAGATETDAGATGKTNATATEAGAATQSDAGAKTQTQPKPAGKQSGAKPAAPRKHQPIHAPGAANSTAHAAGSAAHKSPAKAPATEQTP